jgi:hypothetical protein
MKVSDFFVEYLRESSISLKSEMPKLGILVFLKFSDPISHNIDDIRKSKRSYFPRVVTFFGDQLVIKAENSL